MRYNILLVLLTLLALTACSRFGLGGDQGESEAATAMPTDETQGLQKAVTPTPTLAPSATPELLRGTVRLWHSWNEEQMPVLEQILDAFSAEYPGVLFDVLYVPQDNLPKQFEIAYQEGNAPDLILGPAQWGPALFQAGMLADLNSLADDSLLASINPAALQAARYQEAITGLPYTQQGVVLYRNKALIPQAATTFDQLAMLAKSATQGEIIGADLETGLFYSGGHLEGIGGKWLNADGTPAINDERGVDWLELIKSFTQAGSIEYLSDRDLELFKEGRVGFIIDGTWNLQALTDTLGQENLAVDPWPSYQGGSLAGFILPENIYMSSASRDNNRQAAWKFIEHLLSPDAQSQLGSAGSIPVVSGVKVIDPRRELLLNQVLTALAGGVAYPTDPDFQFYLTPLDIALQSALIGENDPAEALRVAANAIQSALAQAKATPTPAP